MPPTSLPTASRPPPPSGIPGGPGVVLALLLLVGGTWAALAPYQPPAPVPASAPVEDFSAERALAHVSQLAREPHPVGSPEHARVREYLLARLEELGLSPEIQRAPSVAEFPTPFGVTYRSAAVVQNVLARMPGRSSERALLLMAHYDSVPAGPGANDNAAAVATLLETARALRASPQKPGHDVFFLFTDAEEVGLLGAQAFFTRHHRRHVVATVLNFEARGSRGPVLMFETGPDSGGLIDELGATVPTALASSLFDTAYQYLPNMTEFTLAKAAGIPGLNFAYIDGLTDYHGALDAPRNVDARTLQHQGEYALRLTRRLSEGSLSPQGTSSRVFFNVAGLGLVTYPERWSPFLALGATLLWAAVIARGLREKTLSVGPLARGLGAFLLVCVGVIAIAAVISVLAGATHPESRRAGDTYDSGLYLVGLLAVTASVAALFVAKLGSRIGVRTLALAACAPWALLAVLTAFLAPGLGFLFTWPLASTALGLVLLPSAPGAAPWRWPSAMTLCAIPPLLIVAPLLVLTFVGLTPRLAVVTALLAALLCGLLVPLLHALTAPRPWPMPAATLALGLGLVALASIPRAPTPEHPRQNNVVYAWDADSGQALWFSSDEELDDWTRQFFRQEETRQGPLPDFMPRWGQDFWFAPAPVLDAPAPRVELLDDTVTADRRTLRLRITSPRGARSAAVSLTGAPVLGYAVDGARASSSDPPVAADAEWTLWLETLLPEGNLLEATFPAARPISVRVLDRTEGLPSLSGFTATRRPPDMIPAPALDVENWGNATYVSHALHISAHPALSGTRQSLPMAAEHPGND
ncbi:M20/M25/M40 family metallo-hydrolase [Myxococcus stipitatus]|uniref:M20/M25/M40 family metallo-hydrolase n=1 Tax=Myxococcus stipitatus TaxID=83455 RepID=UPI0030D0877E